MFLVLPACNVVAFPVCWVRSAVTYEDHIDLFVMRISLLRPQLALAAGDARLLVGVWRDRESGYQCSVESQISVTSFMERF